MGGSFTYCTLGEPIDTEGLLTGEHLPEYSALAAYVLHTCSGISAGANDLESRDADGPFYSNGEQPTITCCTGPTWNGWAATMPCSTLSGPSASPNATNRKGERRWSLPRVNTSANENYPALA